MSINSGRVVNMYQLKSNKYNIEQSFHTLENLSDFCEEMKITQGIIERFDSKTKSLHVAFLTDSEISSFIKIEK